MDYRPELAVGRWPVGTAGQLRRVVAKTLAFEKRLAADPQVSPRVALVSVGGWVDSRGVMDRMASYMPSSWTIEKRHDGDPGERALTPPPTEAEVVGLLNNGVDLVIHAGHGLDTSWERCLFLEHLDQVHNAARLPVMISAGCSTARFATLLPYEAYVDIHGKKLQDPWTKKCGGRFCCPNDPTLLVMVQLLRTRDPCPEARSEDAWPVLRLPRPLLDRDSIGTPVEATEQGDSSNACVW